MLNLSLADYILNNKCSVDFLHFKIISDETWECSWDLFKER